MHLLNCCCGSVKVLSYSGLTFLFELFFFLCCCIQNTPSCVCFMCAVGCADLTSLDSLSPLEKKRQGYIHELLQTEERYVEDLQTVVEVRQNKSS